MIPFVILEAPHQREAVRKLVAYCRELDGTRIRVIKSTPEIEAEQPHPHNAAFHHAAYIMRKEKAWGWLEADSIPRLAGWVKTLTDEYRHGGKPFMLSSDSFPPWDLVGGIGVFPGNAHILVPESIPVSVGGFDGWLLRNLKHAIHWTPLIQHCYGDYFQSDDPKKPNVRKFTFPLDCRRIRPDAVIFHSNPDQTLMEHRDENRDTVGPPLPLPNEKTFRHSGDLGDVVACLPAIRQLGGGRVILCDSITNVPGLCARESLRGARFEALKPLLEAQPYITAVEWSNEPRITTHDAWEFRNQLRFGESLAHAQARHLGVANLNTSAWIHVPYVEKHDRVVLVRSPRYHNPLWDPVWKRIGQVYGDLLLVVGMKSEHEALEKATGRTLEHAQTKDLLEVAQTIAGASLVYSNQTCPAWITMGLHKRFVEEVDVARPNSIINYSGAFYAGRPGEIQTVMAALQRVKPSLPSIHGPLGRT